MNEYEAAVAIVGIIAAALYFIADAILEFKREMDKSKKRHDKD